MLIYCYHGVNILFHTVTFHHYHDISSDMCVFTSDNINSIKWYYWV